MATQQLTVTATMSDGSTEDVTADADYESTVPAVATVSAAGLVTPVAVGDTVINVSYSGFTGTSDITVTEA